jgi:hypothetical protein
MNIERFNSYITYQLCMNGDGSPWAEIVLETTDRPTAGGWSLARCCSPRTVVADQARIVLRSENGKRTATFPPSMMEMIHSRLLEIAT